MRCFLIDPFKMQVEDRLVNLRQLSEIYRVTNCTIIQQVQLNDCLNLLVNENGLLNFNNHWMISKWRKYPLSGKALLVGPETSSGWSSLPDTIPIGEFLEDITWLGNDQQLERNIAAGFVERPSSKFMDPKTGTWEIMWEWKPHSSN